ncbi:hypothetical protein ACE1CI_02205 [Aerosakkonemataceae cyanobacterium BLCC-F50]|uniref:CopG family transcriptional regulator n=1 Tax=Floridaenema flaviceps BLCC-F50 TaxID=3153642 RepID=A0ABV4XJ78_9CYAN
MIQKKLATFRIDADQWDAFQEWAKRSGTNASALLVNYIEQCLVSTPSRFSQFPDRMNKNLDKRLDRLEQRLLFLETSLEGRIQYLIQQHIATNHHQFLPSEENNQP